MVSFTQEDNRNRKIAIILIYNFCRMLFFSCTTQEAVKITEDIVRTLEFTYQSLTKCFTPQENQSSLDHLFTLIMYRLVTVKDSCKDTVVRKNLMTPQNSVENTENYKFRSAFSVASFVQLPRDAQIQIDAALSEMEAMDYRDWVYQLHFKRFK